MIIFFGPAGAGKSVQGQMLTARHGWRWLSTGQLFRDTHDAELLKRMSSGELIDDETTKKVFGDALERAKDIDHVVLDGFPRTLKQAEWLVDAQKKHGRSMNLVIVLEVPQSEILRRLQLRGRIDDTPETVAKRMNIYRQEIYPILTYLTNQHVRIVHIDGTGSVGQVHDKIEDELESCSLA
ncbi:MAG: nucleoside monophosphate kinase [Candidatus Woesebacteria bacterium]|jgi:adenylate kinase